MRSVRSILENPPTKEMECNRCNGSGMINIRGMVSSDDCPRCDSTGKLDATDYDEWVKMLREAIKNGK